MTTASIYVRISHDPKDTRTGIDNQEGECRALCEQLGFDVGDMFMDNDLSATTGKRRPGFEALLASSPEAIVAWHQDRLLRVTADLERVIELGVNVHMVKAGHLDLSHPAGRAVARTVTAWTTYEGEMKAERQRLANRALALKGKRWWPHRPFGNEMDGSLKVEEAEALRWAVRHVVNGGTFAEASREFNRRQLPTARGNAWTPGNVRPALMAPRIAGLNEYQGEIVGKGQWEAAVPEGDWYALRDIYASRRGSRSSSRSRLLSGVAMCDVCGRTVWGQLYHSKKMKARDAPARPVYVCPDFHVTRAVAFVDSIVSERVCALLSRPDIASALSGSGDGDLDALRGESDLLKERLDGAATAYAQGAITIAQLTGISTDIGKQIDANAKRLAQTTKGSPLAALLDAEDIEQRWGALGMGVQREVIKTLFEVRIEKTASGPKPRPENVVTIPAGAVARGD